MSTRIQRLNETQYEVTFNGTEIIVTTVTSSGHHVNEWLGQIVRFRQRHYSNVVIGFDVEWRPSFSSAQNPVAVLQLCNGYRCLVFLLLHADYFPNALHQFLGDNSFTFVGVGISEDVERLSNDHGLTVARPIDLRGLAARIMNQPWLRQKGLAGLARDVLRVEVHKPRRVTMSHWDRRDLTHDQVKYAAVDAFLSFKIGTRLYSLVV